MLASVALMSFSKIVFINLKKSMLSSCLYCYNVRNISQYEDRLGISNDLQLEPCLPILQMSLWNLCHLEYIGLRLSHIFSTQGTRAAVKIKSREPIRLNCIRKIGP